MHRNIFKIFLYSVLILIIVVSTGSCSFLFSNMTHAMEIIVKGNYFTIEWDNPVYLEKTDNIQSYRIYIRRHGYHYWQQVDEVEYLKGPSCTIKRNDFPPGKYDVGVSAVNHEGMESAIHSSMDTDASPQGGWYIFWIMD